MYRFVTGKIIPCPITKNNPCSTCRSSADGFVVRMELTKAGAGLSNPVSRFRRRNAGGKNPDSQGFKSGDFFALFVKNTTHPLTVWIIGINVEQGLFFVIGHGIIFPVVLRWFCPRAPDLSQGTEWNICVNNSKKYLTKRFMV